METDLSIAFVYDYRNPSCSALDSLYYIEATQTSMIAYRYYFMMLLGLFSSGKCQNKKTDPWLWKYSKSIYSSKEVYHSVPDLMTLLIDNSITWKEDIISEFELLYAYGYLRQPYSFYFGLDMRYQAHINPYRFDKMGFDDTILNVSHFHQSSYFLLFGIVLAWMVYAIETICFISTKFTILQRMTRLKL